MRQSDIVFTCGQCQCSICGSTALCGQEVGTCRQSYRLAHRCSPRTIVPVATIEIPVRCTTRTIRPRFIVLRIVLHSGPHPTVIILHSIGVSEKTRLVYSIGNTFGQSMALVIGADVSGHCSDLCVSIACTCSNSRLECCLFIGCISQIGHSSLSIYQSLVVRKSTRKCIGGILDIFSSCIVRSIIVSNICIYCTLEIGAFLTSYICISGISNRCFCLCLGCKIRTLSRSWSQCHTINI